MYKFFFLFIVSLLSAQQYRFTYSYQMKPDAGKKDSVVTDYMNLDTDGRKSYYYNAAKYERDSAYAATKSYKDLLQTRSYDQNLSYIVEKDYAKKIINFYDTFKTAHLIIPENDLPKWKIENEFMNINSISCQKATTTYKGRVWEAWFSKEYPINDGPYKFSGLPGIIVSIKDSENDHIFNLIQIKKINEIFSLLPKSAKRITFPEYKKIMNSFTFTSEDIESMSINKQEKRIDLQLKDGYIAKIGTDEMKKMKKMDEEMTKRLRRTNNHIERE
ncbi:GLPGLI family protein [Chryseobacterium profundimaris]|uniref:GLPGLI family protein n=1 Tax=Chryseobacterium profundimaris TaxID=1387275 RepID=A0ABY1PEV7_9FLAO|nr:GLPGLI family protein [Chryseobacterium profundimaris]SMP32636.1 GLPGLI family protein [Chryseobacterium profundimaris]